MAKLNVKAIENKARRIMLIENSVWNKDAEIYLTTLRKKIKSKLPYYYYYIFEDANYHSLNSALSELNLFAEETSKSEEIYQEYKKKGGRTWNL